MHMYVHTYISQYSQLVWVKLCCFIDPPAVTVEATGMCTNDFTASWTATSNREGLSYLVLLLPPSMANGLTLDSIMDTSYNFTELGDNTRLMPNTTYSLSVNSRLGPSLTCLGIPKTIMVTTLTIEAGVPQSELLL